MSDTPRTDAAFRSAIREANDSAEPLNEMIGFSMKLERELIDANERIKLLIADRDTARRQADQKYNLREEFLDLLGTDDVEQGVAVVREMKQRIKRLEAAGDAMAKDFSHFWTDRNSVRDWPKAKEAKL